jgi:succinate dehydrogenase/fumarate reductase flavoprotein subunit
MNNPKQTSFDVIVIGAGVAGLSTAMQLAKHTPAGITTIAKILPGQKSLTMATLQNVNGK